MNKKTIIISSIIALVLISGFGFSVVQKPNIAYVDINNVYNGFKYKLELESKYENIREARNGILDSLKIQLQVFATNARNSEQNRERNIQQYQALSISYEKKAAQFEQSNSVLHKKYSDQIWNQLNKYMKEYGELNDFDFIYGADGAGNVMHAKEEFNITSDVLKYVNNRFNGRQFND